MKKSVKLVMIIVLLMAGGCTTQKKEENTRIIDTSMFLYKVSDQKGKYSYLFGTLTANMAIDFAFLLVTFLAYLWADNVEAKEFNKKTINSKGIDWLFKEI